MCNHVRPLTSRNKNVVSVLNADKSKNTMGNMQRLFTGVRLDRTDTRSKKYFSRITHLGMTIIGNSSITSDGLNMTDMCFVTELLDLLDDDDETSGRLTHSTTQDSMTHERLLMS